MTKIFPDFTKIKVFRTNVSLIRLLKPVLDNAYKRIPGDARTRDRSVTAALASLSEAYRDLTTGDDLDYSSAATRFAYIYRYVACHANLLIEVINQVPAVQEALAQKQVRICCLGGGPGTEMLGVSKYLRMNGLKPRVKCTVYDRDQSWGDSWHDLDQEIDLGVKLFPIFKYVDVIEKKTWAKEEAYLDSDLFSMVFFMSEVFKHRGEAEPYFGELFGKAQPGALFIFIDNSAGGFKEWFDALAGRCRLEILEQGEGLKTMTWEEEKADFGEYYEKFGAPRIRADISWRVARKPAPK